MPFPLLVLTAAIAAGPVEIWTSGSLKGASDQIAGESQAKGLAGKTLGGASLWRRSKSGQAELHRLKTDLMVVEQGTATLVSGGTIPDAKVSAPNEVRGSSIRGGEAKKIGPGDIIRIPAGTPHQFVLEKGESISYFALKLSR